jgi:ABC-2 type transport system ATP-binding protein
VAPVLEVIDLSKTYGHGGPPALRGLTLSVEEGQSFGLLGPNGAGKTTAISIICGLLRPSSGTVRLFGRDVTADPAAHRGLFGLVPQETALYGSLTARENLMYFGRMQGLSGGRLAQRVQKVLALLELQSEDRRRVDAFSGGLKRRLNLGVALLDEPPLLILDEPTVGIDVQSRHSILTGLSRLNESGLTLVYTSHYMEEVERLCPVVAIMDHGRVLEQGRRDELLVRHPGCDNLEEVFLHLTGRQLRD